MRVVKCFSLESMATEMLHEAREWELQAQWYKRKAWVSWVSGAGADGEKPDDGHIYLENYREI